ncbi:MAG: restriction endonuclease subunit S [Hyphomicrobiales bacterium]
MSDPQKKLLVPELRFPEFQEDGAWSNEPLGKLVLTVTPPIKIPSGQYLNEGQFPVIDQSQKDICGWTNNNEAVIYEPLPLIIFGDHTCVLKFATEPFAQGADGIKVLDTKEPLESLYLFQFLQFVPLTTDSYKRHYSALKEKQIFFPSKETGEQQKIADCLSSLDKLIIAHTKKYEALKAHKKGLMQQLFPAEGETAPKRRFPEFRDTGDWVEKKFGEITDFASGGTPSKGRAEFWDGDIPWISASSMHSTCIDGSDHNITKLAVDQGARIAPRGTVLLLVRGSMLHKRIPIGIAVLDVAFNQDVKALKLKIDMLEIFLLQLLISCETRLLGAVTKTGIGAGKLDTADLNDFLIRLPDNKEEQQKIADCFSAVDELITVQAQKIKFLKAHKKGLMQQLFPSADKVEHG